MTEPTVYDVEVEDGRMEPVNPDVGVIYAAKWFGITPMDYLDMPVYWANLGTMVRQAEHTAKSKAK